MPRRLRYTPEGGALFEVTCRTLHGRFLLKPSGELNEIILGILGRAQRLHPVEVCAFVFASNHYHLVLNVKNAQELALFMNHVNSNLAREAGRLAGWREKFWSRRYQAIVISNEEGAQRERLKYLLAHGAKENLVERPQDWPGVHSVNALLEGVSSLEGTWFNRTQEYAARHRGEDFERMKYATTEILRLSPLPCWSDLSASQQKKRVAEVVQQIEAEAAAERERTGIQPPGPAAIQAQKPHDQPILSKKSPAPLFHAASQAVRKELYDGYAWFVGSFRQAAEKLRQGDFNVSFPTGCFPPALPFVPG